MAVKYNFVCKVPSTSNPDKKYIIKMTDDGRLTCNCPAWIYNQRRDRTCKHIDIIRAAGFETDKIGRFITINNGWSKSPLYCDKYPDGCDDCALRYDCWVEEVPEFSTTQVKKAGVVV